MRSIEISADGVARVEAGQVLGRVTRDHDLWVYDGPGLLIHAGSWEALRFELSVAYAVRESQIRWRDAQ